MTAPAIEVRELTPEPPPMWHLEILADGELVCRAFRVPGFSGSVYYLDLEHPPKQLYDAGWVMLGFSGSVPVMREPTEATDA